MVVVAVSGPPGAGSSTVAKLLSERLGIKYFSPGQYMKAKAGGNETDAAFRGWKDEELASEEHHNSIDEMQKDIARKGDVVIDGKLSVHMLEPFADLRVFITAPLEIRAERTSGRDRMNIEEVKETMEKRQKEEVENWKEMYGFDYLKKQEEEADMVVDSSDIRPEEIVDRIMERLES